MDGGYLPRFEVLLVLVFRHISGVVASFDLFDDLVLAPHEDLGEELEATRLRYFLFFVEVLNGNRFVSLSADFLTSIFEEAGLAGVEKVGCRS